MIDDILQQQIAYYRARANEYDEWFYKKGRYDRGPEENQRWFEEAAWLMQKLANLGPVNEALELAAGTGIWTVELAKIAQHVTAIDAVPQVLAIAEAKLAAEDHITYVVEDVFEWEPEKTYDLVVFAFWLSHVPAEAVDPFIEKVYRALKPGGRFFMVDSRPAQSGTATNQRVDTNEQSIQKRVLNDGRTFEILKIYHDPAALAEQFESHGFSVEAGLTDTHFVYAVGHKNKTLP